MNNAIKETMRNKLQNDIWPQIAQQKFSEFVSLWKAQYLLIQTQIQNGMSKYTADALLNFDAQQYFKLVMGQDFHAQIAMALPDTIILTTEQQSILFLCDQGANTRLHYGG